MKKDEIKELIHEFDQSSLTELAITQQGISVYMNKNSSSNYHTSSASPVLEISRSEVVQSIETKPEELTTTSNEPADSSDCEAILSPVVGVVYLQPAPGEEPFIQTGQRVKKGDVVCLIEAMKLMNEIVSPYDGTVKKISISNEEVVEYNQPLFLIEP